MGKFSQRRIDFVLKRKGDDASQVEEDQSVPTDIPLPLLEFHQQQPHNQDEEQSNEAVTFRGIEFLQRDPGLRPQIWQYPPDQRDSVRRAYLMLGPMQPQLQNYEPSGQIGQQRRFKYNWFGQFPSWLEYSQERHRAYCFFCFVSGKRENTRGGSHVFTVNGFDSWKRINCGKHCAFLTHVGTGPCSSHQNAVADFTQQDIYGLQLELKHFVSVASKDEELKNISTLIGLCQRLVETGRHTIFNLIDRLLRLLITLPVSTATAERAFSSLKIIKTRLRNKMEDDYLTNSLLVNIEGEILETYSYEDVIEDFRSAKRRRAADL